MTILINCLFTRTCSIWIEWVVLLLLFVVIVVVVVADVLMCL